MSGILTCFHILVDMMAYNPDKPEVNPELSLSDLNIRWDSFLKFLMLWQNSPEVSWKWKLLSQGQLFVTPMDYIVHVILQARILEGVAFSFSRGSSQPRGRTQVSCIAGGFFTSWATRKPKKHVNFSNSPLCLILGLSDISSTYRRTSMKKSNSL